MSLCTQAQEGTCASVGRHSHIFKLLSYQSSLNKVLAMDWLLKIKMYIKKMKAPIFLGKSGCLSSLGSRKRFSFKKNADCLLYSTCLHDFGNLFGLPITVLPKLYFVHGCACTWNATAQWHAKRAGGVTVFQADHCTKKLQMQKPEMLSQRCLLA